MSAELPPPVANDSDALLVQRAMAGETQAFELLVIKYQRRVQRLIGRMVRSAQLAGHSVGFDDAGLSVRGKPLALKRAIGNLLDNALFYGARAEVSVRAHEGWIEIAVRDHGPGVPEDAFPSLFEPYVRLAHGRESNDGGMGLGLGIARGVIEGHGGELVLANHPDGGLNAVIRLPG